MANSLQARRALLDFRADTDQESLGLLDHAAAGYSTDPRWPTYWEHLIKARVVAETILSALPGGAPSTHFKA
jgi:hypothetical protein